MSNFVGIDLGTTNSAICSYDGIDTRIWKSPDQNDVTPSAIYYDRRGNMYAGKRAYDAAHQSPGNAAVLFKRFMGTSTPIELPAVNLSKTPEECSAEVLKTLFGYLTEEIRNNPDTGTVITVPAAFNQMQKDATMQAAQMAGIGQVALMQEPVAAVMSVIRARNTDGMFLIYDLGGGTLDIAISESDGGRINLLAHGGIAMCGSRDFDRIILDNIVKPWLMDHFDLPDNFSTNAKFKSIIPLATWATEKAKIELSARDDTVISLSETEIRVRDLNDCEIYIEIPLQRESFDKLIADRISDTIDASRNTLSKAGLTPHHIERVVFVGGPTAYKPLRDMVSFELGIPSNTDVNPMTAVAEGASLFAESIDWNSQNRSRKSTRREISSDGDLVLSFKYIARTPGVRAKIAVQVSDQKTIGYEFQIESIDTGWSSGRLQLKNDTTMDVTLSRMGENTFKVFVFDSIGGPVTLKQDRIVITKTAATVDAIPASHSIGIEVLEKLRGRSVLDFLVHKGDSLPKKGKKLFKAAESLKARASGSLNFKLWECDGDNENPTDNRPIGVLKISGSDFDDGVIHAGADLICDYEILDSGNIVLEVSIPDIKEVRSGNFYSWIGTDYSTAFPLIIEKGKKILKRVDHIAETLDDERLKKIEQKLESAVSLDPQEGDPEKTKEADEKILEARQLLAQVRKEHLKEIRQIELDGTVSFFNEHVREHARPSENKVFDNLSKTAQRSIERNDNDFENHLDELRQKNFDVLWRQDWFLIDRFKWMVNSPHMFSDKQRFDELSKAGMELLRSDAMDELRQVVIDLYQIIIESGTEDEMFNAANIIRG